MPSISKSQQRLMGQAYAYKKGELKDKDLNPKYADEIKKLSDSMTKKQLKDFAKTDHKGLPQKVKESKIMDFKSFVNESLRYGDIDIHDMVYVNVYGPSTYGHNGYKSDKPFRPVLRNFSDDTKYEVVYVVHNPKGGIPVSVGLFDNSNEYQEVDIRDISLDTPFSSGDLPTVI